jgi:triosephosphate isomerase
VGCTYCLVGHSERRQLFGETDANVHKKCLALRRHVGISPIACLGETLSERESGITYEVLRRQIEGMLGGVTGADATRLLDGLVLAYEPVWAIGTGRTAKSLRRPARPRVPPRPPAGDARRPCRRRANPVWRQREGRQRRRDPRPARHRRVLVGGASLDAAGFARIIQAAG